MPRIAEFRGIKIQMFVRDHLPPHFHVVYGEFQAQVGIEPCIVLRNKLPPRVLALVQDWVRAHRAELFENWSLCERNLPPRPITTSTKR